MNANSRAQINAAHSWRYYAQDLRGAFVSFALIAVFAPLPNPVFRDFDRRPDRR